jgi:hypothetical protein
VHRRPRILAEGYAVASTAVICTATEVGMRMQQIAQHEGFRGRQWCWLVAACGTAPSAGDRTGRWWSLGVPGDEASSKVGEGAGLGEMTRQWMHLRLILATGVCSSSGA